MKSIIDALGAASAKMQRLGQPATSTEKLLSSDHRLYVAPMPPFHVLGFIKVGVKRLVVKNEGTPVEECEPLCVLDFFVCEKNQRRGVGYLIFERMLMQEKCNAAKMAFDGPTQPFLRFLERHFRLSKQLPQPNNYVVFEQFFREVDSKMTTAQGKTFSNGDPTTSNWMTPTTSSLPTEIHNYAPVQGLHLSDSSIQSSGSQTARTPSAGRRKGMPQSSDAAPPLTRRSSSRRLENRGSSTKVDNAFQNEAPKAAIAFELHSKPITRGVSLAFPKTSLSMKIITDNTPSNLSFSSSESITPTFTKPDLIPPWETKKPEASNLPDAKQKDKRGRPSSVGAINVFRRNGPKQETNDTSSDTPGRQTNSREEGKGIMQTLSSRFKHSTSTSPSSSSASNESPSSESPMSQTNGGNATRSTSNANSRRLKSFFS